MTPLAGLDPRRVAANFNQAAPTYGEAAAFQRQIGDYLLQRLEWIRFTAGTLLDVGCGTGVLTQALSERYPLARVYGLDIARHMLRQAQQQSARFIHADAAHLPLPAACADVVLSNLMLQWCPDYPAVFAEFARVLKPDGILLFSTFGPDTLKELRAAWAVADGYVHVNAFADLHDLGDALLQAGLRHPVLDVDRFQRHYPDTLALMRELKTLGARNINPGRPPGLTGKQRLQTLQAAYETRRTGISATYEVIYGHATGRTLAVAEEAYVAVTEIRRNK